MFYVSTFAHVCPEDDAGRAFPGAVDDMVKHAICLCLEIAPRDTNVIAYVESEIRRLTGQALKDFREHPPDPGSPAAE
jgi:hypothetical protein